MSTQEEAQRNGRLLIALLDLIWLDHSFIHSFIHSFGHQLSDKKEKQRCQEKKKGSNLLFRAREGYPVVCGILFYLVQKVGTQ